MSAALVYHRPQLPWYPLLVDRRRFRRILLIVSIIVFLPGVVIPLLDAPEQPRTQVTELPPRLARLIEQKRAPLPPPAKPVEEKVEKEEPKKEEPKKEEKKEKEPKKAEQKTPQKSTGKSGVAAAREKVKKVGLLALSDSLSGLREPTSLSALKQDIVTPSSDAGIVTAKAGSGTRSVTSGSTEGSGGIGAGSTTRETSSVDIGSRGSSELVVANVGKSAADNSSRAENKALAGGLRSQEEIQRTIEQGKGAFYRIYNRALRANPELEGKVVFSITIDGSGEVTKCVVVASDLKDSALEAKLVARIRMFNFGEQNVQTTTVRIPLDFFPA